jgi:hypothetical protein
MQTGCLLKKQQQTAANTCFKQQQTAVCSSNSRTILLNTCFKQQQTAFN